MISASLPIDQTTKQKLLSGNAIFTLMNENNERSKFTYKIVLNKHNPKFSHSVHVMYEYMIFKKIGSIDSRNGLFVPFTKYRHSPSSVALKFLFQNFHREFPPNVKIFHAGRCLKCGRPLTDPTSIMVGLGPICREQI